MTRPITPLYSKDIGKYEENCKIGFDLWQVKSGTIFDNILITDDVEHAKKVGEELWAVTKEAEKKMKDEQDEEEKKKAEADAKTADEDEDDEDLDDEEAEDEPLRISLYVLTALWGCNAILVLVPTSQAFCASPHRFGGHFFSLPLPKKLRRR